MTHGVSVFAVATRQLIETIGPVVRMVSMSLFYVMNIH